MCGVPGDRGRFCDGSAAGYASAADAARAEPNVGSGGEDGANEPAAIACLARFDLEIVNLHGWQRRGVGAARQLFRSSTWNVRMFSRRVRRKRWRSANS